METVKIKAPNFSVAEFRIRGTAPYMQLRFSEKAQNQMAATQAAGSQARTKRGHAARSFDADYEAAMHVDRDGRRGIPASAFRKGMIDACRVVDFKMTQAKMSIFVEADTLDIVDGMPLVFIEGTPRRVDMPVPNANGRMDIRVRARWDSWAARIRVKWDADQFSATDVLNLLVRVGVQVGVGEGRPFSKNSAGIGYGTFEVLTDE
jgi:hypothetical protein